jgi:hypothetical protein
MWRPPREAGMNLRHGFIDVAAADTIKMQRLDENLFGGSVPSPPPTKLRRVDLLKLPKRGKRELHQVYRGLLALPHRQWRIQNSTKPRANIVLRCNYAKS